MKKTTRKKKTKEPTTYLDILPRDVKENVLKPYQDQIDYNEEFLYNGLLGRYSGLLENAKNDKDRNKLLNEMYKIFNKYHIKLKFIKEEEYRLEEGNQPPATIPLIIDILNVYLRGLMSTGVVTLENDIGILNEEMKSLNIPVRIVYHASFEKGGFNGFEIIQLASIPYEINFDDFGKLRITR